MKRRIGRRCSKEELSFKSNRSMKVGDKVWISPDLTLLKEGITGTVIEVEDNPFVGTVISAETEDRNVFFGREEMFKPLKEEVCLP